jgi:uncharacterized protein (DUF305 family)
MKRALAGLVLAAALTVTGCSGNSGMTYGASPTPTTGASVVAAHNTADVMFAQMMVVHHQQAVDMAKLARTRAGSPKVKDLAAKIGAEQGPEIQKMTEWLRAWGGAPMPMPSGALGHGMGQGSVPGMMTAADMSRLEASRGAEFDRMFLTMMIRHHEGAVAMAKTELADGVNPDAKELAQSIVTTQTAEIAEMRELRTTLG